MPSQPVTPEIDSADAAPAPSARRATSTATEPPQILRMTVTLLLLNADVLTTRREILERTATLGVAAMVAAALPLANAAPALGADPSFADGTLQAFFDTLIPGRRVSVTESGAPIHHQAIAGVDPLPGAVEADALKLAHNAKIGFDALAPVFLTDLEARALAHGGDLLTLGWAKRVATVGQGLDFGNPLRLVWEAAAAVAFTAFCAAGVNVSQRAEHACGYRVMGLPGAAPGGYAKASYRRRLAHEVTRHGSLG